MRVAITNATIIDPEMEMPVVGGRLLIEEGRIVATGDAFDPASADQAIDADGCWLLPGLVDLCARLHDPDPGSNATFESEAMAAVSGGVTSLVIPPDTRPVVDDPSVVKHILNKALLFRSVNAFIVSALTRDLDGHRLADLHTLFEAGCITVSNGRNPIRDHSIMLSAIEYAATFGRRIMHEPIDHDLYSQGVVHHGKHSIRLGIAGIPYVGETISCAIFIEMLKYSGASGHIGRVSAVRSLELIERARKEGVDVTADVSINSLLFNEEAIGEFDQRYNDLPPLREESDQQGIISRLHGSDWIAICSNHNPLSLDEKERPFPESGRGISSIELMLPLVAGLAEREQIPPNQAIRLVTLRPADFFGLPAGRLKPGSSADLVLFDPHQEWRLERSMMRSYGKNSPFIGQQLHGQVVTTLHKGRVVYDRGR
jgi:dihydroorotase